MSYGLRVAYEYFDSSSFFFIFLPIMKRRNFPHSKSRKERIHSKGNNEETTLSTYIHGSRYLLSSSANNASIHSYGSSLCIGPPQKESLSLSFPNPQFFFRSTRHERGKKRPLLRQDALMRAQKHRDKQREMNLYAPMGHNTDSQ